MRLRIAAFLIACLLPISAQAAITVDFGAIAATVTNAITEANRWVTEKKTAITDWTIVKAIGDKVRSISNFYKDQKARFDKIKSKYDKYVADINQFLYDINEYYYDTLDMVNSALDAVEHAAETLNRIKDYIAEGKDIAEYAADTFKLCRDYFRETTNVVQQFEEQKERYHEDRKRVHDEIDRLNEELKNLQNHTESNAVTNSIRNTRDKLEIAMAKHAAYEQNIRNVQRQISDYKYKLSSMVRECQYRVGAVKARAERLVCYATVGEAEMVDDQVRNVVSSVNAWNNRMNEISLDIKEFDMDIRGCENYHADCEFGIKGADGKNDEKAQKQACISYYECIGASCTANQLACAMDKEGNKQAGDDYDKECLTNKSSDTSATGNSSTGNTAAANTACSIYQATCGDVDTSHEYKIQPLYGNDPSCEAVVDDLLTNFKMKKDEDVQLCKDLNRACQLETTTKEMDCNIAKRECAKGDLSDPLYNDYCRKSRECQQVSANYSIHRSEKVAFAALREKVDVAKTKSGTDVNGVFYLPSNMAVCCNLNSETVLDEGKFTTCISRYNSAMFADHGTEISKDDEHFYSCIRREIGNPDLTKTTAAADVHKASAEMRNGYAEYLASAYIDAVNAYNDSFTFKEDRIDPVINAKNPDVQSSWAAITNMELQIGSRLNEISRLWAREQTVKAFSDTMAFKISQDTAENADIHAGTKDNSNDKK